LRLTPTDTARLAHVGDVDPAAFVHYLRGTQARYDAVATNEFAGAEQHFARAIARDSTYAPAYAGLALVHALAGRESPARRFAGRALALDSMLTDGHLALGMIRQIFDWDWPGAERALRRAVALNPGHAESHHELSMLLKRRGRFDEALRAARVALYLAPTSARFESAVGEIHLFAGRYDEALAAAERALALDSTYLGSYYVRAHAYALRGSHEQARQAWRECVARGCDATEFGYLDAITGRPAEARRVLDTLRARWSGSGRTDATAIGIATVLVGLGEHEQALDWLERGTIPGTFILYLGINPYLRPLHAEPRFQAVLRRVRLDQ
jgi:tetratricopeptide (TPR) repeat protein